MTLRSGLRGTESELLGMVRPRFERSMTASELFFEAEGPAIARCAAAMADRFFSGGRLLVFAGGGSAADAQHNAVEYVHPVIAGCRALPALSLGSDAGVILGALLGPDPVGVFARQVRVLGRAADIALAFDDAVPTEAIASGLRAAKEGGLLTVALLTGADALPGYADHEFSVATAEPGVAEEVHLATYHILWELVHVILNHRGIRSGDGGQEVSHGG